MCVCDVHVCVCMFPYVCLTGALTIGSKRIYVDFKENARGQYVKFAEVNQSRRSTVIVPDR